MQDNARPHVSIETKEVLAELEIDLLPILPPYSQDLNIIEVIWAIMEAKIEKLNPKNVDQMKKMCIDVWNSLTFVTINGLANFIYYRLAKLNANPGQTLNYYSTA